LEETCNLVRVGWNSRPHLQTLTDDHMRKNNSNFMKRCFGVGFFIPANPDCNVMMASNIFNFLK
jgi:hypothetical protein